MNESSNTLYYLPYTCLINYDDYNTGSTQHLITQKAISNIEIPLPSSDELDKFEKISSTLYSEVYKNKESVQLLNMEFVKGGLVDAGIAVDVATAQNMTDLKRYIKNGLAAKKAENDMITQLQQQAEHR